MPPIFRTLGPVAPPVNPEDIANKGYVDNISPDVLTYFRLSDVQAAGASTGNLYSAFADFGLGNLGSGSGAPTRYSRAPFPMRIIRYGLNYQPNTVAAYNNFISQPYVMQLNRYNPSGTTPPAVILTSATLAASSKYLNVNIGAVPVPIGVDNTDVYQWTSATTGTATNIGTINLSYWFEFVPATQSEIKSGEFQKEVDEFYKNAELRTLEMLDENPDLFKNLKLDTIDDKINAKDNSKQ